MVYRAVLHVACTVMGLNPDQWLWTHDLQVCGSKRPSCHTDLHIVSRCCTRGESEDHYRQESMQARDPPLTLKPSTDITTSPKQGYQWLQKKDLCPPEI